MSHRIEKINELIKQELSKLFLLDFPGEIITINFILTNSDLSESKIYLEISSGNKEIFSELCTRTPEYRKFLAEKLYIRKMPRLIFIHNKISDSTDRIEQLLENK